jgi:hypothetical protein
VSTRKKAVPLVLAAMVALLAACGNDSGSGDDTPSTGGEFNAEEFFAGKTIRFIVDQSAGGGTDIQGRLIAGELGKHIPGNPRVQVTNIPGRGGIEAAYDAGPDELVFGVASQASELYTAPLSLQADMDPEGIQYIGAMGEEQRAFIAFGPPAEGYPTIQDAFNNDSGPEFISAVSVGAPGDVQNESFFIPWLCENLEMNCKFISIADDGSADLDLMIQRGEVTVDATPLTVEFRNNLDKLQDGTEKAFFTYTDDVEMETIWPDGVEEPPTVEEVLPEDLYAEFQTMIPMVTSGGLGKSWFAGPDVTPEIMEVMRAAFDEVGQDQAVMDELATLVSGGETAYISATAIGGEEATERYLASTEEFYSQQSMYEELQQHYYDKYWKR